MKKVIVILLSVIAVFSTTVMAQSDFGWKEMTTPPNSNLIGLSNRGEQGGEVSLLCNKDTHKLNFTYSFEGKQYDLFVFRKFGVTVMDGSDRAGKFIVGMKGTTQGDVYYNVLSADKAFVLVRFPVGSKAIYEKSIATNVSNVPAVQQEGDEYFLTGDDWKALLKNISQYCPVNFEKDKAIF